MQWSVLLGVVILLVLLTPAASLPETAITTTLSPIRLLNFSLRRLQLPEFNEERW
jgi:hypothetical protein